MSDVEPAMTTEEWGKDEQVVWLRGGDGGGGLGDYRSGLGAERQRDGGVWIADGSFACMLPPETIHALAALCLHGKEFGFTWNDVDDLRQVAKQRRRQHIESGHHHGEALANALEDLADRIAALLPPRNE